MNQILNNGDQPCNNFMVGDHGMYTSPNTPQPHECPDCLGTRYFCANCNRDHHENGWESCKK